MVSFNNSYQLQKKKINAQLVSIFPLEQIILSQFFFLLELLFKRGRKLWYYWQCPIRGSEHLRLCAVLCLVSESCSTLCNPVNCSSSGSSVHGDSPGKNTEWADMPSSRGSSQSRDWTQVSRIAGRFFIVWASREGTKEYHSPDLFHSDLVFPELFVLPAFCEVHFQNGDNLEKHLLIN